MPESNGLQGKSQILGLDAKPVDSPSPHCGNCFFWHFDVAEGKGRGFCFGEPPRLFMVAPPRVVANKVQYEMEMMRPKVGKSDPPCPLWKPKNWNPLKAIPAHELD
jgi:hypothetical protein